MITLAAYISQHSRQLEATYLEVTPADVPVSDGALLKQMFAHAKEKKRHVGMIMRQFGGNTYFTYDPTQRPQLEVSLLGAAATGSTEVHVQQSSGRVESWTKF